MSEAARDETSQVLSILGFFDLRERQCWIERRALEKWLSRLTPLRWLTIGFGIVFSAVGGATTLFHDSRWFCPTVSGILALAASVLAALHTGFDCDAHQAECRRLIRIYFGLETAYQAARLVPPPDLRKRLEELESRFEAAKTNAAAAAPVRFRKKAESEALLQVPAAKAG